MISTKPYLLRAIYEWCADQGFTPHLQVAVDGTTRVPREFVRDGQIVLNIGMEATHQFTIGNDEITFQARFNGKAFPVQIPVGRVVAIYARENGQGMGFELDDDEFGDVDGAVSGDGDGEAAQAEPATVKENDAPLGIDSSLPVSDEPPSKPPGGRGHLTRIK